MNLDGQGVLKYISPLLNKETKYPKKQVRVAHTEGEYTNVYTFDVQGKTLEILDNFGIGQEIKFSVNVRGREYEDKKTGETKSFNSLTMWKIEAVAESKKPQAKKAVVAQEDDDDDLPF